MAPTLPSTTSSSNNHLRGGGANAQISDYCQRHVEVIDRQSRSVIVAARKRGSHLVSLKWKTGEFALALCKPGTRVPTDENIVIAYQACQRLANKSA